VPADSGLERLQLTAPGVGFAPADGELYMMGPGMVTYDSDSEAAYRSRERTFSPTDLSRIRSGLYARSTVRAITTSSRNRQNLNSQFRESSPFDVVLPPRALGSVGSRIHGRSEAGGTTISAVRNKSTTSRTVVYRPIRG